MTSPSSPAPVGPAAGPERSLVPLDPPLCRASTEQRGTVLLCRRHADHINVSHKDPDHDAYWLDDSVAYRLAAVRRGRTALSAGHLSRQLGDAGLVRSRDVRRSRREKDCTEGFAVNQGDEWHAVVRHRLPLARAGRFASPDRAGVDAVAEETGKYARYTEVLTNLGYEVAAVADPDIAERTALLLVTKPGSDASAGLAVSPPVLARSE